MIEKKYYISLLLIISFFSSFSQKNPLIRDMNKYLDNTSSSIYNVIEDKKGYIFIGTNNGIIKYNGTSYRKFTTSDGLPSNDIFGLNIDSKNRIWITGYYNGLYYLYNNSIIKIKDSEKENKIKFLFEINGVVYFKSFNNKIFILNSKNILKEKKMPRDFFLVDYLNKSKKIISFNSLDLHHYIMDQNLKIEKKIPTNYIYIPHFYDGITPKFYNTEIKSFFHYSMTNFENRIFEYKNTNLLKYNTINSKFTILNKFDDDKKNTIISVSNSFKVFNYGLENVNLSKTINLLNIDKSSIFSIYIDSKNNYWIIDKGLKLHYVPNNFNEIEIKLKNNIFLNEIAFFKEIEDNVVLTENNSLYVYNYNTNKIKFIYKFKDGFNNNFYSNKNEIIISTSDSIYFFKKVNYQLNLEKKKFAKDNRSFVIDSNHFFFLKTNKVIDSKGNVVYSNDSEFRLNNIELHKNNNLLISNENELIKFDKLTQIATKKRVTGITKILSIDDNNILIGTNSFGLKLFDKNLHLKNNILRNQNIYLIKFDTLSNTLITYSNEGLYFHKFYNGKFYLKKKISENDNVYKERIKSISYDNNNFYITTQTEHIKIIKKYINNPINGEINIDKIKVNNKTINHNSKNILSFQRNENNISFYISIKTNNNNHDFLKYYSLTHNDNNDDIKINFDEKVIAFKNLKPGKYCLNLYLNPITNLSKVNHKKIYFTIEYYFWETKTFILIIIVLSFFIFFLTIRFFNNKKMRKNLLLLKLSNLELKALKAQMNPHFLFNALNNLQSTFFLEGEEKANNFFVKFSTLLRKTLEMVNEETVSLNDELNYIEAYLEFEKIRTHNGLETKIYLDKEVNTHNIKIPVMLLQPIVENSIIHGLSPKKESKKISITIKKVDNNFISISIEDNGVGRNFYNNIQNKKKSFSTKIINERLNIINKLENTSYEIETKDLFENNSPSGTKVTLKIPINKNT